MLTVLSGLVLYGRVSAGFQIAWPVVAGAIVGARRPSQVEGWLPAATLDLNDADLEEIATAIARTGAGSGPARPERRASEIS